MLKPLSTARPPHVGPSSDTDVFTHRIVEAVLGFIVIVFNVAEILILKKKGRKRKILENLILSLSWADLFVGLTYIIYGICKIILIYHPTSSTLQVIMNLAKLGLSFTIVASVLHLIVIAIDRFYAIQCPFEYRVVMRKKRIVVMIITIWISSIVAIALIVLLPFAMNLPPAKIGTFQAWLIFTTAAAMILVYGYLAYYLFSRYQRILAKGNCCYQGKTISYHDQKRDINFCICIVVAFILCCFPSAVAWLLPQSVTLLDAIGKELLVSNSFINPILYLWKSHLSKKEKLPVQPMGMIKWAFEIDNESKRSTPQTLHVNFYAETGKSPSKSSTPASTPSSSRRNSFQNSNQQP